jgi:hypothetical protein
VSFSGPVFGISDGGLSNWPDNGSAYLSNPSGLRFSFVNGALFNFNRFDVAEYSGVFAFPQFVDLWGHKADGSVVEFEFYTDGIFDGTGPLPDFQRIELPASFTDLSWVEFHFLGNDSGIIAIDNVSLSVIPEPSSLWLIIVGAVLMLSRRTRDATAAPCASTGGFPFGTNEPAAPK